jgi:hypothetical protein
MHSFNQFDAPGAPADAKTTEFGHILMPWKKYSVTVITTLGQVQGYDVVRTAVLADEPLESLDPPVRPGLGCG